jgi:hypothetical protein
VSESELPIADFQLPNENRAASEIKSNTSRLAALQNNRQSPIENRQ